MNYDAKTWAATLLRFVLGWYMIFAGLPKVLDPAWSAEGFLLHAQTFPDLYAWFATPANLVWINPLNAWGITLVGVALLLGVGVRPAALGGAALMILYYFPHVTLPWLEHGFVVEEHIINAAAFLLIAAMPAARRIGLAGPLSRTFLGRIPLVRSLF